MKTFVHQKKRKVFRTHTHKGDLQMEKAQVLKKPEETKPLTKEQLAKDAELRKSRKILEMMVSCL